MADSSQVVTYHPAWNSLPTMVWAALILALLLLFRREVAGLLQLLERRLRLGAGLKLGAFEIGHAYVEPGHGVAKGGAVQVVRKDNGDRHKQRERYYSPNRSLMLVHRIAPSERTGQLYDILIYLIPHPGTDASLTGVKQVEYYFGKSWGQNVFTCIDRASGFAIATSAYGPFMCTAEIQFSDGEPSVMVNRYIDFEMGASGPHPESPKA